MVLGNGQTKKRSGPSRNWELTGEIVVIEAIVVGRILTGGGSDANYLNAKRISTINLGIDARNPHSYNEFVLLEDLGKISMIAWVLTTNGR